jgi:hypothetical protein
MNLGEFLRMQASRLRGDVTVGWLAAQSGTMLPGLLIVLAAVPSLLPVPGVGNVTGSALVALALSIWRGQRPLSLPTKVQSWRLSAPHASRLLRILAWTHDAARRHLKRRASGWVSDRAWVWAAWPVAAMGIVIFLPIPLGNVFGALALMVLGLGHSVEDGVAVAVGWLLSGLTLLYSVVLAWGMTALGQHLFQHIAPLVGMGP